MTEVVRIFLFGQLIQSYLINIEGKSQNLDSGAKLCGSQSSSDIISYKTLWELLSVPQFPHTQLPLYMK